MITGGRTFMATARWVSLFPGLEVVLTGIAFSVFGDGLADAPRVRRR
jgi:peptide/nickel transport system permease protein